MAEESIDLRGERDSSNQGSPMSAFACLPSRLDSIPISKSSVIGLTYLIIIITAVKISLEIQLGGCCWGLEFLSDGIGPAICTFIHSFSLLKHPIGWDPL